MRGLLALTFAVVIWQGVGLGSGAASGQATTPPAGRPQTARQPAGLAGILDWYLQGRFDEAIQRVGLVGGFKINDAQRWISAGGRSAVERRRLAVAALTLEYSALRPQLIPLLVTWSRDLVAGDTPDPTEALWLRASVAMAEGYGRWQFLRTGLPPLDKRKAVAPGEDGGHLAYARRRFPDDPYFKMADVVGAEFATSPSVVGDVALFARSVPAFDQIAADLLDTPSADLAARRQLLERAAAVAEGLLTNEAVRAEANLRLGYICLRLGQTDRSLRYFDAVTPLTTNPRLRYTSHLFAGWTLGRLNRVDEAVASYRAALRTVPRARSATTFLTALFVSHSRLDEAEVIADDFLSQPEADVDPWRSYFLGDYPSLPSLIARLRDTLR